MSVQGVQATTSAQITDFFAAENGAGIDFFSAGRFSVQIGFLTPPEIDAVLRSYRRNLRLIQKISPSIYNDLVEQQTPTIDARWPDTGHAVLLKMAQIAKGTLASQGGTKVITWPPQVGQIGVAWLDPYLLQYSRAKSTSFGGTTSPANPSYTDYTPNTWTLPFSAAGQGAALAQILGSSTYTKGSPPATVSTLTSTNFYQSSGNTNQRQLSFIFQNGVLEIGTTPDIQQWIIQSSLTTAYNTYTTHPLVTQPIEERKLIFQYNTPGVIPLYNDMGLYFAGLPQTTTVAHTMPLLGMSFYETNLLPAPEFI